MLKIIELRTDYLENPLGIDNVKPRFMWKIASDKRNVMQQAYQIICVSEGRVIWDSRKVESNESARVIYAGEPLCSRQRVDWKVRVWCNDESAESGDAWFEMGLLSQEDWKAKWIEPEDEVNIFDFKPAPYLRKEFVVKENLRRARIYQSAHGLYECWMNGKRCTEDVFKPGLTTYYKRLQYQVYDITGLLETGNNCWAAALGDGWWRGLSGGTHYNNFGYKVAYIGQIELEYEDGKKEFIATDESFDTAFGALEKADMMHGEIYNAEKEPEGWKLPGFDSSVWKKVHLENDGYETIHNLISSRSVPVREKETFLPVVLHTPDGNIVFDYGQNIAGYVTMKLHNCKPGQRIILRYGETLDKDGNFTQDNFIMTEIAKDCQKIEYIAKGGAVESYCPIFSIFGFRYVQILGYDGEIDPEDFKARAVYSSMKETGRFQCSDPLVNKLVSNSFWSQKGNFMDVPTDCPTRERSPWTGDAQVFAKTATKFMDVYSFFEKWMLDYNASQYPSGKIPQTIPSTNGLRYYPIEQARVERENENIKDETERMFHKLMNLGSRENGNTQDGACGWGDAATIIPYTMYLCYGDKQILKNQFASAKKWVDYICREAKNSNKFYTELPYYKNPEDAQYVWDTDFHYGEWLEADQGGYEDLVGLLTGLATHPDYITATTYFFYSAKLVSEMAQILGLSNEAAYYADIASNVKRVFNKYFIHSDGMIKEGRQAPGIRALAFGIVEKEKEKAVASYINRIIVEGGYKLNTGFLSTPFLLHVLADYGYEETAFKVLEQKEDPSWLKPVKDGATTIMENWRAYENRDASFNHYSYGAVCDFLFSGIAGIKPQKETPGYKHFLIKPIPGGTLTYAEACYDSVYGIIESYWRKTENGIDYHFQVPANTTATICVKGNEENYQEILKDYPDAIYKDGFITTMVGSGDWNIKCSNSGS